MGRITLYTVDEYEPQPFDAALVRERSVVCVRADEGLVRMVPLDKVNHVDGDRETMLVDEEIPDSFYGGADCGFVDPERFPEIESHLDDLGREAY